MITSLLLHWFLVLIWVNPKTYCLRIELIIKYGLILKRLIKYTRQIYFIIRVLKKQYTGLVLFICDDEFESNAKSLFQKTILGEDKFTCSHLNFNWTSYG